MAPAIHKVQIGSGANTYPTPETAATTTAAAATAGKVTDQC